MTFRHTAVMHRGHAPACRHHVTARSLLTGVLALVVILPLPAWQAVGQSSPSANPIAITLRDNIGLLQFVTQATLSAQERQELAQEVTAEVSKNPQGGMNRDHLIDITLANAGRYPLDAPRLRELWRYDIAAHVPHNDAEYQIVERHDPTLMLDATHQRIVTEETLVALRACTEWLMGNLHKPAPGPGFIAGERAYLRASYWHLGDDAQDAYAHVARNCPRAQQFFAGTVAAQRTRFFAQNATKVTSDQLAGTDAALIARIAYNIVVRRHGGSVAAQGRLFDYMIQQSLLNQQLQRSVMSNPPLPPPN